MAVRVEVNTPYNILISDVTLAALLPTFEGIASVFTDEAPADAVMSYVIISGPVSNEPFDTKNSSGRIGVFDIGCYGAKTGSAIAIDNIADRCRESLHRVIPILGGISFIYAKVFGPSVEIVPEAYLRLLSLHYKYEEV